MGDFGAVIYIVVAIIIGIVSAVNKANKNKAKNYRPPAPRKPKQRPHRQTTGGGGQQRPQSIEDIFKELYKGIEEAKPAAQQPRQKSTAQVASQLRSTKRIEAPKGKDYNKLLSESKKRLEESQAKASGKDIYDIKKMDEKSIQETEGAIFDVNNVNWAEAVIAKEILDRKYV